MAIYAFIGTVAGCAIYTWSKDDDKENLAMIGGVIWPLAIVYYLVSALCSKVFLPYFKWLKSGRPYFSGGMGEALRHCVYRNEYYKKDGVLVIGARVKNKRMETIELDIKSGTILQCRGKCNKNSSHHQEIYNLMQNNIQKFIRVLQDNICQGEMSLGHRT